MFKDYHHLFARHLQDDEQPSFLECQGIIEHKAVLMPLNVVSKQQTALRARCEFVEPVRSQLQRLCPRILFAGV